MTDHDAYPAALTLPGGTAHLVPGMAVYLLDGVPIDVDVTIPDDLAYLGWFWWGSRLAQQRDDERLPGISIDTGTYPPPGVPALRGTCFDAARKIEETRARMTAEREAAALRKAAKKPKAKRVATIAQAAPEPAQRSLWEDAA
jgi:hypothetical protein